MDNFITSSSGHQYSSLDGNFKRSRHSDKCILYASQRAYGTVLYVRSSTREGVIVILACSKNRLAPVKKITVPRLEILTALVGARLLEYFSRETGLDIRDATLWTDATVALNWISSNPSRWKIFVCNRVTEKQTYTTSTQCKHCPGVDILAGHLSRGVNADQLKGLDRWWKEPAWLPKGLESWPCGTVTTNQSPPEKGRLLILSYTFRLLHLCLIRQSIVPIGGCCA